VGKPSLLTTSAQSTPVTALEDPTERSMPPAMIRKVIPTAAMHKRATWRTRPIRFCIVRKLGLAMERKTKIRMKTTSVARPWILRNPPPLRASLVFSRVAAKLLLPVKQ
jgi:hypothetical protein